MKIAVCGRNLDDLRPLLEAYPVEIVTNDPELVISYGGDGALLGAERDYPEVPKCPIRDSRSTPKCAHHAEKLVLEELFSGRMAETRLTKVQAIKDGQVKAIGLNDIVISRLLIASAVRYRIWLDGDLYAHQIVGDGLVVSTPFGSTGYYRSITHSLFRLGLGLAFNNSTEPVNHLVIDETSVIRVEILRGPAVLLADNDPAETPLEKGDVIEIMKTNGSAVIRGLDIFRCPDCYWLRQHQEDPQ
jgi:NAD+ kinase